jgi:2-polyprenyl-6-methoxyphenol hydroxylase-like FAD-dependent oxidoreductase
MPTTTIDNETVQSQPPQLANMNSFAQSEQSAGLTIDALIVGAGPAGASLACFLSSYGITGLMVSTASGTADTPRAHITNMAALECLRDIGLDEECAKVATHGDCMMHTRWCHSMAGEEFARIYSWGNDPQRRGEYDAASPCNPADLPQTLLEPILVRYAVQHSFKSRFNTSFVSFKDEGPQGVLTTLHDNILGTEYHVRSKYLFGADGARSRIVKQLGLPLNAQPGGGVAINVLVKADLSHLVSTRKGNLHWVMQPDREQCDFGWMGIIRMVKPWHEWMFILIPKPGVERPEPTKEEYLRQVKNLIGDDSISAEILGISKWFINEIVAEEYSKGNVFCLGDAVHRHPPFNGLGSNTCIQDAFNLAWKIGYVHQNRASSNLLSTFSIERQPVGHGVIKLANDGYREHRHVWKALGMLSDSIEERRQILAELSAPTAVGEERRAALQAAIENSAHEFHGLGIEMNQTYNGPGVYTLDEDAPFQLKGLAAADPILYHMRSTYPGRRLPHAWLNKAIPGKPISTIDLAGKGCISLFTGIGGEVWRAAAANVSKELDIKINVHSIGFRQDWEDVYYDWTRVRGVKESGAVLVRPDRFVAWRCSEAIRDEEKCFEKLLHVMRTVLGWTSMK